MDMGRVAFEAYYAGQETSAAWESLAPEVRESFRAAADGVLMYSDLRQRRGETGGGMDFSDALAAVKGGAKITRGGWAGPGMYVVHQPGYPGGVALNANTAKATGLPPGTICKFLPYLMFRTAQGGFVPWLASQTDLLAGDWRTTP